MARPQSRSPRRLVIVGNGMVGHALVRQLVDDATASDFHITVFGEEPRIAYDRVRLSSYFDHRDPEKLALTDSAFYADAGVDLRLKDQVVSIHRDEQFVQTGTGTRVDYDVLVLATGSFPFVPPITGAQAQGSFVYRTIEDLLDIERYAKGKKRGHVIGGGLLGLEAAKAVKDLGLETSVIEFAPRLMPMQLDDAGGKALQSRVEQLGVAVFTDMNTQEIMTNERRQVRGLRFADGSEQASDMVVFSAGIRPRDELARQAGLTIGPRGGIVIDEYCRTSDHNIFAIGECALFNSRIFGLVAPGYDMARTVAAQLGGQGSTFDEPDMSTKLKLLGVDVCSFGDAFGREEGARAFAIRDELNHIYKRIVVSADGQRLLGGMLVGDASEYDALLTIQQNGMALPTQPESLILPALDGDKPGLTPEQLPDSAQVCSCNNVTKGALCSAIRDEALYELGALKTATRAGTGCGGCNALVGQILNAEKAAAGLEVQQGICEHFPFTRQELFHQIKVGQLKSFDDVIDKHGKGTGCEICKPTVASILASTWNELVLQPQHAPLQDTNDRFLANMQKDGTYSVIPRIPGGEITPTSLIKIGEIARKYGLYTKITGGQRIDMFGARVDQLPRIWRELVDAGFESGHAYGKALRTVKSCVGSTWCRYGQQDSVGCAVRLEHRYRGIRAPHKLKSAVSGCTRECAEAQSKDFGVIATEEGYNLYVCGNGGMKPQHAQLIATDLTEAELVKLIDRFLMFYIRTADKLQRTAPWLNSLDGGIEYLKSVIIDDKLGICDELERDMEYLVSTYQCEWKATIEDPIKLKRFRHFVNTDDKDDNIVWVSERGQSRPATEKERKELEGAAE